MKLGEKSKGSKFSPEESKLNSLLKRIFHIRTSSILIVSVEHYFLFLRLFSFFLVATCVSFFIGKQTIDNLFLHLKGNPNGLNFFITTMREISKCAMFYLSTFSIALSQQHPFIGFISSFVFAEVHIHSENTLNQL